VATSAPRDWRIDVLRSIGAPVTKANLSFLAAWQRSEGGHTHNRARFNWLNTTSGTQFPKINNVGVRAFPNYQTGIQQTVATLQNGRYRNIEAALRSGNPIDRSLAGAVSGDLQTWVSGKRSGNPEYAKRVYTTAAQSMIGGGGAGGSVRGALHEGWGFISSPENLLPGGPAGHAGREIIGAIPGVPGAGDIPVVGGALDAASGAVSGVGDAAGAVVGSFRWVFGNWDRMLLVGGGFIVMLIGLVMLGRALSKPTAQVMGGPVGRVATRMQYGPTVTSRRARIPRETVSVEAYDQPRKTPNAGASQDYGDVPF
jgi:hypothetical protein